MKKRLGWIGLFVGFVLIGYVLVKDTSGASSNGLSGLLPQQNINVPVGGLLGTP